MLGRTLVLTLAFPVALTPFIPSCTGTKDQATASVSDAEYSRLIHEISEDGGYFWSNNYISNETSYLHVMDELESKPVKGGVYVGVGPNQNFTYIAAIRPELAFIVDIRRQNLLEHLLFKVLIEKSASRGEYLSRLLGRPLRTPLSANATLPEIVAAIESASPDEDFFRAQLKEVDAALQTFPGLALTETDFEDLRQIYHEFYALGLEIKYDTWRSFFFPSLKEFLLETDLSGRHRNWLSSVATYQTVRDMERENRIIPIVGDFAGEQAFRRLGSLLESRGSTVSAFYLSNVEFYLFRQRRWLDFVENVRALPTDEKSVFIRAYANLHRPHPKMVGDHITVTLVQNIHAFLRNVRRGRYHSLWDVVTVGDDD